MFTASILTTFLVCLVALSESSRHTGYLAPLECMDAVEKYPNEYLVTFFKNHTLEQHFRFIGQDMSSSPRFERGSRGYQATMDDKTRDEKVRRDPGVRAVEANRPLYAIEPHDVEVFESSEALYNRTSRLAKREFHTSIQKDAPYGLQMLASPKRLDIPVKDGGAYEYFINAGLGVQAYVMDTGIRTTHEGFGGRARHFKDFGPNDMSPYVNSPMTDKRGHGTHVAGIIGAEMYGVAPLATLVNVKVIADNGQLASPLMMARAIDDITAEHKRNKEASMKDPDSFNFRGSVINLSLSWVGTGTALVDALIDANDAGISVYAAAGNQNEGYGDRYPCASPQTKCIAAVDGTYNKWKASNYGGTVDFVAPGYKVASLHSDSDIAVALMSGTSQATPHAAGAAAIFTSWSGLETHFDLSQNFVYWNSIAGLVTGFSSSTTTYLINTGIHSPLKRPGEPFRFAKENPHKPQAIDDPSSSAIDAWVQSAPPSSGSDSLITGIFTDMATVTLGPIQGLSTISSEISDIDVTEIPTSTASSPSPTDLDLSGQQIAFAAYIDPGANPDTWDRLIGFPSDKVSVLVANVVNGPDSTVNSGWKDVIPRAKASGKTVLGYVRTGYLGVSFQHFTTRLGSSLTSDWVAQIQEDVDQWYKLYPGSMGGIFFDEAWNDCGDNNVNAELYKFITQSTKKKYKNAMTVLNPGAPMPQCFEHSADTLLTAEVSYSTYTGSSYAPNDWTPKDPRKIWHIVYDVPAGQGPSVAALAKQRNVGLLHITDDVEPNPYDTVPGDGYMSGVIGAISGGKPLIEGIVLPTLGVAIETVSPFLKTTATDYTSVAFAWAQAINAIGYRLYQDGAPALDLPPFMTAVTVGGLTPGQTYVFYLVAINPDGTEANYFDSISLSTTALPKGGHTVSSTSVSASLNQAVYSAKILVPYAFVRLFLWNGNCKFVADAPATSTAANTPPPDPINWGWPINFQPWYSVCNQYMVEDGKLHKYTGVPDSTTGYMPWSWKYIDAVPVVQDGYDWTWTLPLGTADINPKQYIVQVQGYGPRANVYNRCPQAPESVLQFSSSRGITVLGDYCI